MMHIVHPPGKGKKQENILRSFLRAPTAFVASQINMLEEAGEYTVFSLSVFVYIVKTNDLCLHAKANIIQDKLSDTQLRQALRNLIVII